jgi:molecular chaperone DnaK
MDGGAPRLVPNERGEAFMPTCAALGRDGSPVYGEAARGIGKLDPSRYAEGIKAMLGSGRALSLGGRAFEAEELAAGLISVLKSSAEAWAGEEASFAAITVPASWDEARRRATREAGFRAGFPELRLVNEPTAAALAYASASKGLPERCGILVLDLGGGTFDASILRKEGASYRVLASTGEPGLGGEACSAALRGLVLGKLAPEAREAIASDPLAAWSFGEGVEALKRELSASEEAELAIPFISGAAHARALVRRDEFEDAAGHVIERAMEISRGLVEGAKAGIDLVVLAGGASRMPMVRRLVRRDFGMDCAPRARPEELVALGAALVASLGLAEGPEMRFTDLSRWTYGVEIAGGGFQAVLPKGRPLPARCSRLFATELPGQACAEVHVLQGESKIASENLSLGRLMLTGIESPEGARGTIRVEFGIDEDDILHIAAKDLGGSAFEEARLPLHGGSGPASARLKTLAARLEALAKKAEPGLALEAAEMAAKARAAAGRGDEAEAELIAKAMAVLIAEIERRGGL